MSDPLFGVFPKSWPLRGCCIDPERTKRQPLLDFTADLLSSLPAYTHTAGLPGAAPIHKHIPFASYLPKLHAHIFVFPETCCTTSSTIPLRSSVLAGCKRCRSS